MRAKRSLGQNFLHDSEVINKIVDALNLTADETVIEIGPGRGALTEGLIECAGKVIAIEFDREMIALLRGRFGDQIELIEDDVLDVDLASLVGRNAKLVGNLPYNISTPILQKLIDVRYLFSMLVLMFQREVVERITAEPGSSDRGYLTVLVEAAFDVERLFDVPPTAFRPVPKVWSSVARLTPIASHATDHKIFRNLLSVAFAQKRKTILNNLKTNFMDAASLLNSAAIDSSRRAETLTLDEWLRLTEILANEKPGI